VLRGAERIEDALADLFELALEQAALLLRAQQHEDRVRTDIRRIEQALE